MRKKKIAVVGLKGLPAYVGAGTVGENIINQLKGEFDFYVYSTSSHTPFKTGYYNGIYQKVFNKIPFKRFNAFWYYLLSAIHARLFGDFDLVHVHNSFAAFTMFFLKKKYPVVLTTHGGFIVRKKWKWFSWFFHYNTNKLVKKADYLCCVSLNEKRQFKEKLGLDSHYIPNGINTLEREKLPIIPVSEPYILFSAGRIIPTKGLHELILALQKIDYKGRFLIAGDLDQMPSYKKKILSLTRDLNITFLGLIKEKDLLLSYMKNAEFLVFPSHTEAMSMVLLEAVSVGCPVVCSDIIENRDILKENEVVYFKTSDIDDLAEKTQWALNNPNKLHACSEIARNRLLNEMNWENVAEEYKKIFLKMTGKMETVP